jgi:ZIP family zinc transporter
MDWKTIATGSGASLLAGLATAIGAIPFLAVRRLPARAGDLSLGFSAGVMLAASFFSLILPGLRVAEGLLGSREAATVVVIVALLLGAVAIESAGWVLGAIVPRLESGVAAHRVWLLVLAITLHNFPEGMAVGIGFGSAEPRAATALAVGIGLQNVPEGLAVASALYAIGFGRMPSVLVAAATGLVEPVGGLLGVTAVAAFAPLLPWGLGFAAGAMIYVISSGIIPEMNRTGGGRPANAGLMAGLAVMMLLDVVFS